MRFARRENLSVRGFSSESESSEIHHEMKTIQLLLLSYQPEEAAEGGAVVNFLTRMIEHTTFRQCVLRNCTLQDLPTCEPAADVSVISILLFTWNNHSVQQTAPPLKMVSTNSCRCLNLPRKEAKMKYLGPTNQTRKDLMIW